MEIWKDVVGYEGIYQVSSLGRVKSFCRDKNGRILKPGHRKDGYLDVYLYRERRRRCVCVHWLVAEAFLEKPSPDHTEVNHRNGNKADNRVKNLEWVTHEENQKHAAENGLMACGEAHGNAKLTDRRVRQIRRLYATGDHTQRELGKMFGIAQCTISHIINRDTWKHI